MEENNKNKKKNKNKTAYILTKETLGMTLLLFSGIVFIMLLTFDTVFAGIGKAVCTFMFGTFGYGSLLIIALLAYLGEWLVFEKKFKISLRASLVISLTVFVAFLLFHAATSRNIPLDSYGGYISECYKNAALGYPGYTFGGVISALLVYPVAKLTTFIGAYIIFSLFVIACGYLTYITLIRRGRTTSVKKENFIEPQSIPQEDESEIIAVRQVAEEPVVSEQPQRTVVRQQPSPQEFVPQRPVEAPRARAEDANPYSQKNLGRKILFEKGEFDAESYRRNMIFNEDSYFNHPVHSESDYLNSFSSGTVKPVSSKTVPEQSYSESFQNDVLNQPVQSAPSSYVYGDKPVSALEGFEQADGGVYSVKQPEQDDYTKILREQSNNLSQRVFEPEREEPIQTYTFEEKKPPENSRAAREEIITERNDITAERSRRIAEPEEKPAAREEIIPERISEPAEEEEKTSQTDSIDMFKLFGASNSPRGGNRIEPDISRLSSRRNRSKAELFDDDDDEDEKPEETFKPIMREPVQEERAEKREIVPERKTVITPPTQPQPVIEPPKQEEKPKHVWKKYVRPGLELLDDYPEHSNVNTAEIEDNKRTITETLSKFKIECDVSNVVIGPAVTRYDVIIEDKTKITQSLKYKEAIAMALMKDNVTAYLNFSKGALSIEVPNNTRTVVGLKSMLASPKFINSKADSITFCLGKNVEGEVVCPDVTKMPHLLVAGTTGSGKSICLSALLVSLLYKYGPEELRLILVDPKQVEFIPYDKLPHLMINEIIYDVDKAIKALNWAIKEMERRYSLFKEMSENGRTTKNLVEYNQHLPEGEEKLPKIVIILDEFGDLMLQAKKDIEGRIIKLVQKARACGIHLILATQRPSVDCITGLIKSNLPTRIGFKVNSFDDARTIFDIGGAEKLLGKGDLYFRSAESPDLARIQGCFVDSHEVQKVTDFVKAHNETFFDQSVSDFINTVEVEESSAPMGGEDGADMSDTKIDDTYIKALYYCVTSNQASVSMIQRRFPVGYIKACKIIDWMENMNYVTQSEGSKPRKVLLTKDEFINTYGEIDD